jgi:hypothetical protein
MKVLNPITLVLALLICGAIAESADAAQVEPRAYADVQAGFEDPVLAIKKHRLGTWSHESIEAPGRAIVYRATWEPITYVIPTCWGGKTHSDEEAVRHFTQDGGSHFGGFRFREDANMYAELVTWQNEESVDAECNG